MMMMMDDDAEDNDKIFIILSCPFFQKIRHEFIFLI
jgi:hypothetical protein